MTHLIEPSLPLQTAMARALSLAAALCAATCAVACADASAAAPDDTPGISSEPLPISVASVPIPDSDFARAAAELAFSASPETLYNHVFRTYLFGSALLDAEGLSYDRELAFVAAMLHDLGLVDPFMSADARYELDGADAAARFLRDWGRSDREIELVWDAIALHTNPSIAVRKAPEVALIALGAGLDVAGIGYDHVQPPDMDAILSAYPRLGFKRAAVLGMIEQCQRKPFAYVLHPWAEVGRRHIEGFLVPTAEDLALTAPFSE
jgi:HD domain